MRRVTHPGGVVAFYVWDYPGEIQLMRYFWDTAVELDPEAADRHEGRRFLMCQPGPLTELVIDARLSDVAVREVVVPTRFRDFDDHWRPFLGGRAGSVLCRIATGRSPRRAQGCHPGSPSHRRRWVHLAHRTGLGGQRHRWVSVAALDVEHCATRDPAGCRASVGVAGGSASQLLNGLGASRHPARCTLCCQREEIGPKRCHVTIVSQIGTTASFRGTTTRKSRTNASGPGAALP
jgi:hypothetical protein